MMRLPRFYSTGCFFVTVLLVCSCTRMGPEKVWDNPYDPDGTNPPLPVALASDTNVAINVPVTFSTTGNAKRSISGFVWSFDRGVTWETVLLPENQTHSWGIAETGANLVLVRAIDTAHFLSPPDSIIVNVHSFIPVVSPVADTVVGQHASVVKRFAAFDTNSNSLTYFWFDRENGTADTSSDPVFTFRREEGGPLNVRWGVVDKDGNAAFDTFCIRFNRPPSSVLLTEPSAEGFASFVSFDDERKEGGVRFGFNAADPDGPLDALSFSFFLGTDTLARVYSGGVPGFLAEHMAAASDFHWKVRVYDSFGDSCEARGMVSTAVGAQAPEGMKFIRSRSKSFVMGQPGTDSGDTFLHTVSFSYHFWMDSAEVTARDFSAVMGFGGSGGATFALPAAHCTWYDAALYCNARSKAHKLDTVYSFSSVSGTAGNGCILGGVRMNMAAHGYRLPTEAEWEFACRGGSSTVYFWGSDSIGAGNFAWTAANAAGKLHPVGVKTPNGFGLYDMAGNVGEWCNDWFGVTLYYPQCPVADPAGPADGSERVIRGGGFEDDCSWAASARRGKMKPAASSVSIGFRTVLVLR